MPIFKISMYKLGGAVELHILVVIWLPLRSTFQVEEPLLQTTKRNKTKGGQRPINHLG